MAFQGLQALEKTEEWGQSFRKTTEFTPPPFGGGVSYFSKVTVNFMQQNLFRGEVFCFFCRMFTW